MAEALDQQMARMRHFFGEVSSHYFGRSVTEVVTCPRVDLHLYMRPKVEPERFIHIKGILRFSDEKEAAVTGEIIDRERWFAEYRANQNPDEVDGAYVGSLRVLIGATLMPYDVSYLRSLLEKDLPILKI